MYQIGSQPDQTFFSEEEKQDSIHIDVSDPEIAVISNQYSEREISTMVVVKWSDNLEELVYNIDNPWCGGLYK